MVGVDKSTKGGMWTVVENYLDNKAFIQNNDVVYVPTSITCCNAFKKVVFTLNAYKKIAREYQTRKFSILHVHMSERASIIRKGIIMRYAKKKGTRIVLHMHGAEFEVLYEKMSERKKKQVREIINLADKIIILGNYWYEFIGSLVRNKDKICVVYNAVKVPAEYKYDIKSNKLLFLGAVSHRKGIDILIRALKLKELCLKEKSLVYIYGPDVEGNIEDLIKEYDLDSWVIYGGWLTEENKKFVLEDTSINVLPSYNEGLPMTILEAMSYGIPTISTKVAAIPEAVNEKNGILIEPGNVNALAEAIELLVLDSKLRNELSYQSYKDAVEKFSIEQHIQQIELVYKELNSNGIEN